MEPLYRHGYVPTDRERELINDIARGMTNNEIAEASGLTPGTVRQYLSKLFARARVKNRTELVAWAGRGGYIDAEHT